MRNIRIADPADRYRPEPAPRKPTSRLVNILATVPIVFLLPALIVAWFPTSAAAGPAITATPTTVGVGQKLTIKGSDFGRRATVQLTWDGSPDGLPVVTVSGNGGFRTAFKVPKAAPGSSHLVGAVLVDPTAAGATAVSTA